MFMVVWGFVRFTWRFFCFRFARICFPICLQMSVLVYAWVPTLWQRTAKVSWFLVVAFAVFRAVFVMASMSDVVCLAGEREDMPKTRVSVWAVCVGFWVFM